MGLVKRKLHVYRARQLNNFQEDLKRLFQYLYQAVMNVQTQSTKVIKEKKITIFRKIQKGYFSIYTKPL